MAIIQKEIELVGLKGRSKEIALFDSGRTYSLIVEDIASKIADILPVAETVIFETAKPDEKLEAKKGEIDLEKPNILQRLTLK